MGPHPIPQNVTSFQFKLVGDMTLKQFMYLAIGSGIAYVLFIFFAKSYPFVSWPLIVISASLGVAFAFLPINSRPLDYWLVAFLKAIYSPTKRIWKKDGKTYKDYSLFNSRLAVYLSSFQPKTPPQPQAQPVNPTPLPAVASAKAGLPTTDELGKTVDLARQAQNLQMRILQTEKTLSQLKSEASQPTPVPVDLSPQVNKVMTDLQNLVTQASATKQQLETVSGPETPPAKVRVVVPAKLKQTQLALTTFPNVINGIVKDSAGNYLDGVIAVIYDKDGLPVRALKTNKLGQFSGSTPLTNGSYTLEMEKDSLKFDVLQIELAGAVLPPIIIVAKQ